jgi:hypothetical protein
MGRRLPCPAGRRHAVLRRLVRQLFGNRRASRGAIHRAGASQNDAPCILILGGSAIDTSSEKSSSQWKNIINPLRPIRSVSSPGLILKCWMGSFRKGPLGVLFVHGGSMPGGSCGRARLSKEKR